MSKSLPSRPDLDHLRKQAKDLLKQSQLSEQTALERFRLFHPDLSGVGSEAPSSRRLRLHDAQLVIAREYGFASWPRLKAEIELRQKSFAERADYLVKCATEGQVRRAAELIEKEPELARANIYTACVVGETEYVEETLRRDRQLAVKPGGPDNVAPLLYLCFSGFLRADKTRGEQLVDIARLLLKCDADPNSTFVAGSDGEPSRLSAVYAAAGRANHFGLTKLLLEAGADPNDGESLYHSAEFKDLGCTRLLLEHGAKIEGTNAVHHKLDFNDLAGLRLFLDHGADPNLRNHAGDTLIHTAISKGRDVEFLALLAERGADLRTRNSEGLTPFKLANRLGQTEAVRFLTNKGATDKLEVREEFIAACARGDQQEVIALVREHQDLVESLGPADSELLPQLAWRGQAQAVSVMLNAGFDVAATGANGETALHNAAWMGHLAIVRNLLEMGAPIETKEPEYMGTPTAWALHGAVNSRDAEGKPLALGADHAGVLAALLAAGAEVPVTTLEDLRDSLPESVRRVVDGSGPFKTTA